MVTQKFDLNMIPGKPKPIIRASQYDTGLRAFEVSLFAGTDTYTIPSGATLTVQGTKPDYTGFSYSATYSGNTVSFDCTDQMTACAGAVEVEIVVVNDGERVATANFVLQVEPAALKDDTIISETDIPIIEKLPEMMEDMDKLISTFGGPNVAETAAEMTDQDKVYVYIGSETGYNSGHWYYYDKTDHVWKAGGIYQSAGMNLDTTLSASGRAADAKAVGDALALKANLASPTFTGYPKAPTASLLSYNTQIANTEFVQGLVMPLEDAVKGLEPSEVPMHLVVDGTTGTWEQGGKTYTYDLLPGDEVKVTAGERDAYLVWYTIRGGSTAVDVSTSHTLTAGSTRQWGTTDARTLAVLMEDASENDVSPAMFTINGIEKGLTERVDELETTKQDTLTFDSTPTEGSTNPVTSGGVWEAVQTDKTLAVEDKAADAKITGDAITELENDLSDLATINKVISVNKFNKTTATNGGYLNSSGKVNAATDMSYGYSDYIPVSGGDKISFYRRSNLSTFPGCLYYENGTVASIKTASDYTEASTNGQPSTFTVPSGVYAIKINIYWAALNQWMVTINDAYPSTYDPYRTQTKINDDVVIPMTNTSGKSVLYGKNIMFCGDSITYGAYADEDSDGMRKNYGYYIEKSTGCNALFNAISGSTMMNVSGKNPFSVDRYKQLGTGLDYIILAFVTNDSAEDTSLIGQYGDTTNNTFWGAWKIVLDYLIQTYPTAKIGIIGFWRGNQRYQWTDALREIAHKYRIPFLDFMLDPQVPMVGGTDFRTYYPDVPFTVDYNTMTARQAAFLNDTVHPKDAGYQYLATIIQNYLEKL